MKNEKIICSVHDCKNCDCECNECKLKKIEVCHCDDCGTKESTMCDSYDKK